MINPVTAMIAFWPIVERTNPPSAVMWCRSELERAHRLPHRVGALHQGGSLRLGELHLDHPLHAAPTQLHRHAEKQSREAVLALEPRRAGQDAFLVVHDGLHHL